MSSGVGLWTKQGRGEVRAKVVIDASGDARRRRDGWPAVLHRRQRASAEPDHDLPPAGRRRAPLPRRLRRRHHHGRRAVTELIQASTTRANTPSRAPRSGCSRRRAPASCCATARASSARDGRELNPLFWRDFTEAEIQGRRQVREYARFFRDHLAGCENAFVNDTGVQVGVRQTRQMRGVATLRNDDVLAGASSPTASRARPGRSSCTPARSRKVEWLLRRLLRGSLRLLRARARREPARGGTLPVGGARSRRLGARHRTMLLLWPRDRACRLACHQGGRAPARGPGISRSRGARSRWCAAWTEQGNCRRSSLRGSAAAVADLTAASKISRTHD